MRSSPPKSSGVSTMWINALCSLEKMPVAYERAGGAQFGMYWVKTPFSPS